jgi:GNAT superfamily N-acetyltransferase
MEKYIVHKIGTDENINNIKTSYYNCRLKINKKEIGYCNFIMIFGNTRFTKTLFISYLHIHKQFRNQKYGTKLLHYVSKYAYKKGIYYIELADMSDNYNKKNNIYIKFGLIYNFSKYVSKDCDMKGNLRHMLCNYKK